MRSWNSAFPIASPGDAVDQRRLAQFDLHPAAPDFVRNPTPRVAVAAVVDMRQLMELDTCRSETLRGRRHAAGGCQRHVARVLAGWKKSPTRRCTAPDYSSSRTVNRTNFAVTGAKRSTLYSGFTGARRGFVRRCRCVDLRQRLECASRSRVWLASAAAISLL